MDKRFGGEIGRLWRRLYTMPDKQATCADCMYVARHVYRSGHAYYKCQHPLIRRPGTKGRLVKARQPACPSFKKREGKLRQIHWG